MCPNLLCLSDKELNFSLASAASATRLSRLVTQKKHLISQEGRCKVQNRERHPIPKRTSAEQLPTHRAGHSINHHPEDEPYLTDQRKRYSNPLDLADDLDYPGERTRMPTSARRYVDTRGNRVIEQGNRRLVIHDEPPPKHRRRPHWLALPGIGMILMLLMCIQGIPRSIPLTICS